MSTPQTQSREAFFQSIGDSASLLKLFDFVPGVFLYVKNLDGQFMALNEARVAMSRAKSADELLGKTDLDLHPVYWGERYQQEDRRVIESGKPIVGQVWLVPDADGHLGTFVSSKIPLRNSAGECVGIAGVMYRIDQEVEKSRERPLQAALRMITEHYADNITVSEIAKHCSLSPSQLNRRFQAEYRLSPSQYLQRVRVHEASRLLSESSLSMSEIALRTGFYDQAHFSRTFRRWMQMTPKQFRGTWQQQ